jgi:hypothetical protein
MNVKTLTKKENDTTIIVDVEVGFMEYNKTKKTLKPTKTICQLIITSSNKPILSGGWETKDVITTSRFKSDLIPNNSFYTLEQLSAYLSRTEFDKYFEDVKELNQKVLYHNTIRNWYKDVVSQVGFTRMNLNYATEENPARTAPIITTYSQLIDLFYNESKRGVFVTKAFIPDNLIVDYAIKMGIDVGSFKGPKPIYRGDGAAYSYTYPSRYLTEEEKTLIQNGEKMYHFSWLGLDFNISEEDFFYYHYF